MSFKDNLLEAMTNRLDEMTYFDLNGRKVVDYTEREDSDGYCETCYYEYTVIEYEFDDGSSYKETTSFSELIKELV